MDYGEYSTVMRAFIKTPESRATLDNIVKITPHLTDKQRQSILCNKTVQFSVPPLCVKDCTHVIEKRNNVLCYAYTKYSPDDKPAYPTYGETEAKIHGMMFWNEKLNGDVGVKINVVTLLDSANLDKISHPKFVSSLGYTFKLNEEDYDFPSMDKIASYSTDPLILQELRGPHGIFTRYNCARCGGGLCLYKCTGCHREYCTNDKFGLSVGHSTPLPSHFREIFKADGVVFEY